MCLSAGRQLGSSTQWWLAGSSLCTGVGCLLVGRWKEGVFFRVLGGGAMCLACMVLEKGLG